MKPHLFLAVTLAAAPLVSAHDHFAAGIADTNSNGLPDPGEPLRMIGPDLTNRIFHLLPRPVGFRIVERQRCGGYYGLDDSARTLFSNDSFSLTSLSDGTEESGDQYHAHTGAFILAEIVSVSGPSGGSFGFWDVGTSAVQDTPDVSFMANEPTGNHAFVISGGYDAADQDPHGDVHGRAWTADKPGDYYVTFRFVDRSTTGPDGGPWHAPSAPFVFHFKAGPDFQPTGQSVQGGFKLTWASRMGIREETSQTGIAFTILRSTTAAADDWTSIGTVTGTTADTATFTDPSPPSGKAFYRLSYGWSAR
ncbi:MAG: hypothetical protein ABIT37_02170 [Luteolibacter sp.]